jgi:hypothetical protein
MKLGYFRAKFSVKMHGGNVKQRRKLAVVQFEKSGGKVEVHHRDTEGAQRKQS